MKPLKIQNRSNHVLKQSEASADQLHKLASSTSPEVRLAVARHPAATLDLLALLATDGIKEIRGLVARHPKTKMADLQRLVRAGSTLDLMGLSDPDASMQHRKLAPS